MSVQVKGSGTIGGLDEGLVVSGIVTSSTEINVGSNIKIGSAGVCTATSFVGSGANLTSIPAGQLTGTVADARISTLTSSKLSGALPAISGANLTSLPAATQVTLAAQSSDTDCYPVFSLTATGNQALYTKSNRLSFNSVTGALSATSFVGDGSNLTGLASRDFYGFKMKADGVTLQLVYTNSGADNITGSEVAGFEESFVGPSGVTFSINTSGNLIMTV